jgi:hypothetical protein
MSFYTVREDRLEQTTTPPPEARPLAQVGAALLPPLISDLHQSLRAWAALGKRPGGITADRVWVHPTTGILTLRLGAPPHDLLHGSLGPDLAAWLVLLDKWMETFVVIARARAVWTPAELAVALPFVTPAWLPPALVAQPPDNWLRVARALAQAVGDKPLHGAPTNRHWTPRPGSS